MLELRAKSRVARLIFSSPGLPTGGEPISGITVAPTGALTTIATRALEVTITHLEAIIMAGVCLVAPTLPGIETKTTCQTGKNTAQARTIITVAATTTIEETTGTTATAAVRLTVEASEVVALTTAGRTKDAVAATTVTLPWIILAIVATTDTTTTTSDGPIWAEVTVAETTCRAVASAESTEAAGKAATTAEAIVVTMASGTMEIKIRAAMVVGTSTMVAATKADTSSILPTGAV